ncbi:hypothetical protein EOL70_06645 [Leucothrix sargassi]|nr:hypothetical protein EOL70_06645 [Leucothrix sargassi]
MILGGNMKLINKLFTASAVVVALGLTHIARAETTLTFANFEPATVMAHSKVFAPWAKHVEEASGGDLKIKFFTGGALGRDPRSQLDLVTNGVADMAWVFPFLYPERFPQAGLMELPMEILNLEEGTLAINSMYDQGVFSQGMTDVLPLALFSAPPSVVFSSEKITSLIDLKGRKAAATGATQNRMMQQLGTVPVGGIHVGNMAESLSRGTVSLAQVNFTAADIFRVSEVAKHATVIEAGAAFLAPLMNRAKFDSLSKANQKVLLDSREVLVKNWISATNETEEAGRKKYSTDPEFSILTFNEEERAVLRKSLEPVTEAWVAKAKDGQKQLDTLRAEIAKHR